ncbi:M23 family metallopeptidase [Streptomyces sp. NPDC020951]|uniref:M23 family metallopeptidase n=1 Tax=Streptomyces sp. NPDC020951 TaxID=3365104 RepID=UPI0037A82A67
MGREHHAHLRAAPGVRAALLALLALLLLALATVPAGAGSHGYAGNTGNTGYDGNNRGGDAARAVRAHEAARERVERLRESDALASTIKDAERRRRTVRDGLWDRLRAGARGSGDPVAVDPSGRGGRCRFGQRSRSPQPQPQSKPQSQPKPEPESEPKSEPKPASESESESADESRADRWTAPMRRYWLSAGYAAKGSRWARRHTGQDFAVNSGTPVYAVGTGTVRATTCGDGFGNQVLIRHGDGYFTQYAHLSRIDVRKDQRVTAGQRIGLSGASGNVTGPHLHFEVRITPYLGSEVAPLPWLRRKAVLVSGTPAAR